MSLPPTPYLFQNYQPETRCALQIPQGLPTCEDPGGLHNFAASVTLATLLLLVTFNDPLPLRNSGSRLYTLSPQQSTGLPAPRLRPARTTFEPSPPVRPPPGPRQLRLLSQLPEPPVPQTLLNSQIPGAASPAPVKAPPPRDPALPTLSPP